MFGRRKKLRFGQIPSEAVWEKNLQSRRSRKERKLSEAARNGNSGKPQRTENSEQKDKELPWPAGGTIRKTFLQV